MWRAWTAGATPEANRLRAEVQECIASAKSRMNGEEPTPLRANGHAQNSEFGNMAESAASLYICACVLHAHQACMPP